MKNAKICVIGCGAWGRNHVRTLSELGNLAAIMDPDEAAVRELCDKFGCKGYTDLNKAIDKRYDGYVCSAPAELHFEIGKKLLSAGLPVLMEKPMTLRVEESEELVRLSKVNNTVLMTAHILLFHPAIRKLKEYTEKGIIGNLFYLYSTRIKYGTVRTHENVFWSFAPHDIALLNYISGSVPVKMAFTKGNFLQENICDYATAQFEYDNNVKAHIFTSWLHPFKEQRVVVVGSKGMLYFNDAADKKVYFTDKHIEFEEGNLVQLGGDAVEIPYEPALALTEELKYFIDHLRPEDPPVISTCEEGLEVVRILENLRS